MIVEEQCGVVCVSLLLCIASLSRVRGRDTHGLRERLRLYRSCRRRSTRRRTATSILLRAGQTFVGHYTLRAKAGTGVIVIRSDARRCEPAGGRQRDWCRRRARAAAPRHRSLARIIGRGGAYKTTPLLRTEPGAHGYVIRFIEFDGVSHLGYETLIQMGADTTAYAAVRHHLRPRLRPRRSLQGAEARHHAQCARGSAC